MARFTLLATFVAVCLELAHGLPYNVQSRKVERRQLAGHEGDTSSDEMMMGGMLREPIPRANYTSDFPMALQAIARSVFSMEMEDPDMLVNCSYVAETQRCMDPLLSLICPVSCELPQDHYCTPEDEDEMAMEYMRHIYNMMVPHEMMEMLGNSCEESVNNFGKKTLIEHPNGDVYTFCNEPLLGVLCSKSCNTNCWKCGRVPAVSIAHTGYQLCMDAVSTCNVTISSIPLTSHRTGI
eukprot:CAMPEP_0114258558 /NCGR_PEP_ID=MMETSP0058-20121206/19396_1 /TAXON_ID=36894 /ORGANISM="Pyramimonas parkeae, CCMP726" /LENGTH=237 /DNA_ID=CAMNT_0001373491 /DNA_START=60 /DNA_END=773 /DNA_ORIENTATION=-